MEYRSSADTYEVEASSEKEAENLVGEGKGKLVLKWEEHDFYETSVKELVTDVKDVT
jgi:hypothetical protein